MFVKLKIWVLLIGINIKKVLDYIAGQTGYSCLGEQPIKERDGSEFKIVKKQRETTIFHKKS